MPALMRAMGHDVRISKKGYLDLVHVLAGAVQKAQRESASTGRKLGQEDGKIGELELKHRLLAHDAVTVADLRKQLAAKDVWIAILAESSANLKLAFLIDDT